MFVNSGSGGTPLATNPNFYNGPIPFLGIADITDREITSTKKSITELGLKNSAAWIVPAGSVSLAMYASVGKVGITTKDLATSQAFYNMVFDDDFLRDFVYTRLEKADMDREWEALISTGTQRNLNAEKVRAFTIDVPSHGEMIKIAGFFKNIDSLLSLHQRKLEKLQAIKKSLLQKMFPAGGEDRPQIRFAGYTDAWGQERFGDVFEEYSEKNHAELPPLTIIQGQGTVLRENSERNLLYDKSSLGNYKKVSEGDFILHLRSFEGGLEVARQNGIISPAYHTFHGENTDSRFYYPFFRSHTFINVLLKPYVYGIRDGKSIDVEGMKEILIPHPSYEEQRQIGDFFEKIDDSISLHQRKLEKLQQIKKALLEQMFC